MTAIPRATGLRDGNTAADVLDAEVKKLRAEVARLREALAFYDDENRSTDFGKVARTALKEDQQ